MITLRKAMKILDADECYTIGTENGSGWLYYFDGQIMLQGADVQLKDILDREIIKVYERDERKYSNKNERKWIKFIELEKGIAFIIEGYENGTI